MLRDRPGGAAAFLLLFVLLGSCLPVLGPKVLPTPAQRRAFAPRAGACVWQRIAHTAASLRCVPPLYGLHSNHAWKQMGMIQMGDQ